VLSHLYEEHVSGNLRYVSDEEAREKPADE
jgi:hypothetical protein